jgi:hypothetical protein
MLCDGEWCYQHKESHCPHEQQVGFEEVSEENVDELLESHWKDLRNNPLALEEEHISEELE